MFIVEKKYIMIKKTDSLILRLLRASLFKEDFLDEEVKRILPKNDKELKEVLLSAGKQGVSAIVGKQILQLPKEYLSDLPKKSAFFQMVGVVHAVQQNYKRQYNIASAFASALSKKGVKCIILKGISFSTYYNDPSLRECGDCDCYLGNDCKVGDSTAIDLGGQVAFGTYKHSHIHLNGLLIENHRYLTEFNNTKQGKRTELVLQEAIKRGMGQEVWGSSLICPNSHFNVLFLVKHALDEFLAGGITLRMLYDWAALLRADQNKLCWTEIYANMQACGIKRFADLMTAVCIKYFGLRKTAQELEYCNDQWLVDELIEDTLYCGMHPIPRESLTRKSLRVVKRFVRMWHYRKLASENVPTMIWNSFAFSSYLHRNIEL